MRKILFAIALAVLAAGSNCICCQNPPSTNTEDPQGINPGDGVGSNIPELGAFVSVRIISESSIDADVVVRYLVGTFEVRRTELHVPAGITMPVIGPDLAARVEIRGAYMGGANTPPVDLILGTDFQGGDTKNYVIPDVADDCPDDPSKTAPGQCGCGVAETDTDADGLPDCIDACAADPAKITPGVCGCGAADTDSDADGALDCLETCDNDPSKTVPGQCGCGVPDTNSDEDTVADCLDGCPADPLKTAPGACGCGVADVDSDGDGTPDCIDGCPADAAKVAPGACGCGEPETDTDEDGTADCADACPEDPLKTQPGGCGCGFIDDADGDEVLDCDGDLCPEDPDKNSPGVCGCGVPDTDSDGDETPDCIDGCPSDPEKVEPGACGCGVSDIDSDEDETPDCDDLCPEDPGKTEPGLCGCGESDTADRDEDGTPDCIDGCLDDPDKTSPGICGCDNPDTDTDEDGTPDCNDLCPEDPNKVTPGDCGCNVIETPDCGDCNHNEIQDDIDIIEGLSRDCDENGVPDECQLAQNLPNDCDANGVPDDQQIAESQGGLDCNFNGRLDMCDIELGGPIENISAVLGSKPGAGGESPTPQGQVSTFEIALFPPMATTPVRRFHSVFALPFHPEIGPMAEVLVTFRVIAGPNTGFTEQVLSDESGVAVWVYSGTGQEGTDTIEASFTAPDEQTYTSNTVTNTWVGSADVNRNCIPDECEAESDADPDGDGVPTCEFIGCDNCPDVYNPDQRDSSGTGTGDACLIGT